MSYRGSMEGWHEDENECLGNCGVCEDCERIAWENSDYEYDMMREEEEDLLSW